MTTLPLRRQDVQTRMRLVAAPTRACTGRRLTFQRRLVTLCAWLMRFPACGFLPQISHCCAMTTPRKIRSCRANLDFTGTWPDSPIPSRETETTKAPISRGQTKLWVLTAPCDAFSNMSPRCPVKLLLQELIPASAPTEPAAPKIGAWTRRDSNPYPGCFKRGTSATLRVRY